MRARLAAVMAAAAGLASVAVAPAAAGDRILLTRDSAEFTAGFFAVVQGAPFDDDVHVNCRKRIALNVRRCRVHWEARHTDNKGRLEIAAFRRDADANRYRVRYRLHQTDKRCAAADPLADCTSILRGHDWYTGG